MDLSTLKINYAVNILSVLLASTGVLTGGITSNPVVLSGLTTAGILLKSYHEFKNIKHKADLLKFTVTSYEKVLKGLVHDNAHARRLSLQNKFVGSTLNSKSPLPVQSLTIFRFIRTSVALAGLVILR